MKFRISYIFLFLSLFIYSCEKEEEGRYMVFTGQVNLLQYDNIEFNGRVQITEPLTIVDHGFILRDTSFTLIQDTISLGALLNSGNFSFNFETILNPEINYSVFAFIETDDGQFFGKEVSFKPLALYFSKIYPAQLYFNDTLTLEGKNLLPENGEMKFYLNDILCEEILKTGDKIQIKVPETIENYKLKLKISVNQQEILHGVVLTIKSPVIESFNKTEEPQGDVISINGDYLGNEQVTKVFVNSCHTWYSYEIDDLLSVEKNQIRFRPDNELFDCIDYLTVIVMEKVVYAHCYFPLE